MCTVFRRGTKRKKKLLSKKLEIFCGGRDQKTKTGVDPPFPPVHMYHLLLFLAKQSISKLQLSRHRMRKEAVIRGHGTDFL